MKTRQMRKIKASYSELAIAGQSAGHHCWHLGSDSKADGGVGKLHGKEKGRLGAALIAGY